MAAVQRDGYALGDASEEMKRDKEVVMAAVQNDARALQYAPEEMKKELEKEAESFDVTVQEYAAATAHPTVIQLFASEGIDAGGYGGVCLKISCLDMGGEEVLTFPLNTDADDAQKLCGELAKMKGVSPAALHIINQRGERLRDCRTSLLSDFVSFDK
jgi:polyphosphate kinase 2 (PPK2 family)